MLYSIVKLRLPEDHLISALSERALELLHEMTPKDLAVTMWSLARLDYPVSPDLINHLQMAMHEVLAQVLDEPDLFDTAIDQDESSLIDSELNSSAAVDDGSQSQEEDAATREEYKQAVAAMVTPQTLAMYYYGFAKLTKRDKRTKNNLGIFSDICRFLSSDACPVF